MATILALSFYSYLGESLRLVLDQLFGSACHLPGTVGWNAGDWAPCTTAPGTTASTGGALFSDLPANMLGCFLLGLLISSAGDTTIPVDMPMVILKQHSTSQQRRVLHMGLRTGLCGSLTTFAGWNVQIVQMLCGGTTIPDSQWVSALMGYLVGWMMALQAYQIGMHVAIFIHRFNNPILAEEANHIRIQFERGILVHRELPDLERRFLHNFRAQDNHAVHPLLQQWKDQTTPHRGGGAYWKELCAIEQAILVRDETPNEVLQQVARDAGWDVNTLQEYKETTSSAKQEQSTVSDVADTTTRKTATKSTEEQQQEEEPLARVASIQELQLHGLLFFIATIFLIWGYIALAGQSDAFSVTYRTNFLSTLLSPLGTLLRWKLSSLNPKYSFPVGTLCANLLAVFLSSLIAGLALQATSSTVKLWEAALQTGFCGSLSTVSTYIAETHGLFQALPRHAWGYYYSLGTLGLACIVGVASYIWAVV